MIRALYTTRKKKHPRPETRTLLARPLRPRARASLDSALSLSRSVSVAACAVVGLCSVLRVVNLFALPTAAPICDARGPRISCGVSSNVTHILRPSCSSIDDTVLYAVVWPECRWLRARCAGRSRGQCVEADREVRRACARALLVLACCLCCIAWPPPRRGVATRSPYCTAAAGTTGARPSRVLSVDCNQALN